MPRLLALVALLSVACATPSAAPSYRPSCRRDFCETRKTNQAPGPWLPTAPESVEPLKISGPINSVTSGLFGLALVQAVAKQPKSLTVIIDSPGGSVDEMLTIIELLNITRSEPDPIPVRCEVRGLAASAAAIILEAGCTTRAMTRSSQLMFHEPATIARGKEGDFRRTADDLADTNQRIATLIAWRMGMTAEGYSAWIRDRDRWLDAPGALKLGAIDEIIP